MRQPGGWSISPRPRPIRRSEPVEPTVVGVFVLPPALLSPPPPPPQANARAGVGVTIHRMRAV
jgi:hypothetical protein